MPFQSFFSLWGVWYTVHQNQYLTYVGEVEIGNAIPGTDSFLSTTFLPADYRRVLPKGSKKATKLSHLWFTIFNITKLCQW